MTDCSKVLDELKSDDNEVVREAAFLAGELKCEDAVPQLADLLKSSHLGLQEAADHALRRIGGKGAVQAVVPLLRSDDAPVRNLSMDILREVGLDRVAQRDYIARTTFDTIDGKVKFTDNENKFTGDPNGANPPVLGQWQNGVFEVVWPKDVASAPLIHPKPEWP